MQTMILEIAVIVLSVLLCITVGIVIIKEHSLKKITSQLKELKDKDTNMLLQSSDGGKAQNELIKEINKLITQLRQERRAYIRKKHDLDMMITNISHDLRTPLTSAKGYAELIDESTSPDEIKSSILIIQKRLDRLNELINSFFEFSRIISGDQEVKLEETDIIGLLEESAAHYYDDFVSEHREITLDCSVRPMMLKSNPQMLMRIFDNLIGNARKHGIGTLKIKAVQNKNQIELTFTNHTDTKITDTEKLFDEFYTSDISRTAGNSGLGLAIAKEFTQMLSGEITAEAKENEFTIKCEFKETLI